MPARATQPIWEDTLDRLGNKYGSWFYTSATTVLPPAAAINSRLIPTALQAPFVLQYLEVQYTVHASLPANGVYLSPVMAYAHIHHQPRGEAFAISPDSTLVHRRDIRWAPARIEAQGQDSGANNEVVRQVLVETEYPFSGGANQNVFVQMSRSWASSPPARTNIMMSFQARAFITLWPQTAENPAANDGVLLEAAPSVGGEPSGPQLQVVE